MGKTVTKSLNGVKLAAKDYIDQIIMLMGKKLTPGCCLSLPQGYIHVYDHYLQTSSPLKLLGKSMPNFMWSFLGKGELKFIKMVQVA